MGGAPTKASGVDHTVFIRLYASYSPEDRLSVDHPISLALESAWKGLSERERKAFTALLWPDAPGMKRDRKVEKRYMVFLEKLLKSSGVPYDSVEIRPEQVH